MTQFTPLDFKFQKVIFKSSGWFPSPIYLLLLSHPTCLMRLHFALGLTCTSTGVVALPLVLLHFSLALFTCVVALCRRDVRQSVVDLDRSRTVEPDGPSPRGEMAQWSGTGARQAQR